MYWVELLSINNKHGDFWTGKQCFSSLIPQIDDLIDSLAGLLESLKTEIDNLDVKEIDGLSEVASFTDKMKTMLETAKNLLPDKADDIDSVLSIADVVSGLPSLDEIKQEITTLLDDCIGLVEDLKSA
jgi:hypothetical protein